MSRRSSNFIVRGGADFSAIPRETARTQATLNNFQRNVSATMKKIKLVLGAVVAGNLIKESTKMAMATESSLDNISRNMGESSREFQSWVETQSKSLGMAKADAYQYGSVFSNL